MSLYLVPLGARDCTVMTQCLANVPCDSMEGVEFMLYIAASHQRVMFCFEFTFGEFFLCIAQNHK